MEFFVVLAKHHGHLSLYKVADRRRFLFLFSIFIVYIIVFVFCFYRSSCFILFCMPSAASVRPMNNAIGLISSPGDQLVYA